MSETKPPTMEVIPVGTANRDVYNNLAQGYEAEFSAITGKSPTPAGSSGSIPASGTTCGRSSCRSGTCQRA